MRRERQYSFKSRVGYRVGGVRCNAEANERIVQPLFSNRQSLVQIVVGVTGIGRGEFNRRNAEHGAHAVFGSSRCSRFGEKVHVIEAGDAALEHFGAGEACAIKDKLS